MADSPYVFVATVENFRALVLENSDKGPVLVNYWSPRAGPCLMPRLVRLATEFGGRFLLVMFITDERGAESEAVLRAFISKHVACESAGKYAAALQAWQRGEMDLAVTRAAGAALAEPDNPRFAIDLVKRSCCSGAIPRPTTW